MTTSKVSSNAKKMQLPVESLVSKLSPEGVARYIPHDKSICAVFGYLYSTIFTFSSPSIPGLIQIRGHMASSPPPSPL